MALKLKYIITLFAFYATSFQLAAQVESNDFERPYAIAAGLKVGNVFQLDYKHFVNPEVAINFSAGSYLIDQDGIHSSLTISYHHDTKLENTFWYYGGGLAGRITQFNRQIGMATVFGLESVTRDKLINFFIDIQPTAYINRGLFSFSTSSFFSTSIELEYTIAGTVGVRYIFK